MKIFWTLLAGLLLSSVPVLPQDTKENADFKLAVNLYNDKLFDLALEQFRQFVNLYPNTQNGIEARFYLGLSQAKLGKHEDARITFQNFALAFQEHPKAPDAWWNVGEAYVASGNLREAAMAFERVKTFHPKSKLAPSALSKAGEYFEKANDRENAKKVLRALTQEYASTDILPSRLRLAELLTEEGQFDQARVECKAVADASKDSNVKARALVMMAQNLISLERTQEAEKALNQVITSHRGSSSYHQSLLTMGRLKRSSGTLVEALAAWRAVTDDSLKAPKNVRQHALLELGDAAIVNREYDKAFAYYDRAAWLNTDRSGEAYFKAGMAAERMKDLIAASDRYTRALTDTSASFDRRAVLIGAFKGAQFSKNHTEAVRIADLFGREFPSDPMTARVLLETADTYRQELQDPHQAIGLYQDLLARFPQSSFVDAALFGLGAAFRQGGEFNRAIEVWESLPRKYPSSDYVIRSRQESDRVRIFELKDREAGQEKLALLVGDVIEQKSKGDLAFRLADIYFHHLKDYAQAAAQYQRALASDLDAQRRPAAWFYQAKSFEYLSLKQDTRSNVNQMNAVAAYDSLLNTFPASEFTDEAQIAQFNLKLRRATSATEIRRLGTNFLSVFPNARRKDVALLAMANSYHSSKSYGDAALTYKLILERFPQSEIASEAFFRLGETLFEMGDKDSSASVLTQFISAYPGNMFSAQAAFLLAAYSSEKGRAVEAVGWYDRIEKQYFYSSFNKDLDAKRGDAFYAANNFTGAIEYYQRHLNGLKNDFFEPRDASPEFMYKLAVAYDKATDRENAKKYYAEYLLREPSSERKGTVYYALSQIARAENRLDLATKYLQEVSRFGSASQSDEVALESAELLFRNEQYSEAITRFGEVAGKTKNDTVQQYLLSRIAVGYFRLDNVKEAEKRAANFIKSYPSATSYVGEFEFERGKHHFRRDELDKARQRFDVVRSQFQRSPAVPEAMYWTARIHELQQRPEFAVQLYDSILQYYPASGIAPRTQLSLGNVYYNMEQWEAAAKLYRTILDNPERSPELVQYAMNNLILTYKESNLFDGALELTRKYIASYPEDPDLVDKRIDIGVLYQKLGYYDQSIMHLTNLLETGNSQIEPELRYYIGEAYFFKGEYQQAILEFLKVPYLVGRTGKIDWTATSYYMAGQSYEKMNKYDQAMTMYKQIIDRPGIDVAFKTAAQREIDRVKSIEKRN
ncbi:MAG: tetratricopeptide repeat protein [Ignavibacteriales bacterium]|nr:tetratricopeptide repeat protein [Ignavibacteriales bacterium]